MRLSTSIGLRVLVGLAVLVDISGCGGPDDAAMKACAQLRSASRAYTQNRIDLVHYFIRLGYASHLGKTSGTQEVMAGSLVLSSTLIGLKPTIDGIANVSVAVGDMSDGCAQSGL